MAIDVFGALLVGLENDVGLSLLEGFFQRGKLLAAEVFGNVFAARDNADEAEAGLGISCQIVGERFGIRIVADDDNSLGGAAIFLEGEEANPADGAAKNTEESEAAENGVEGHDTDRKKVDFEEEVVSNDGHHADQRGEEKLTDFAPTTAAGEGGFFIQAEGGHDDNVDRDKPDH